MYGILWISLQCQYSKKKKNPIFICSTKVGRIMVWHIVSVRPSADTYIKYAIQTSVRLSTGVTISQINFNFTDIIHPVCSIHDTGNGSCSSSNMRILTQLLIFTFWSLLRPFFKLGPSNFGTVRAINRLFNRIHSLCNICKILFSVIV